MANDNLKAKLAEYDAAYAKNCEKVPARQNLPEQPVYTPLDLEGFDYERDLGFPGFYPYTQHKSVMTLTTLWLKAKLVK